MLLNYRADPAVVQRYLPKPFRPKLQADYAVVGICLIRLEAIRPVGLPAFLGLNSENAAHRIAIAWDDSKGRHEGVFIPRRDTNSLLNFLAGGRIFPGEHQLARFDVQDGQGKIDFKMKSRDSSVSVSVTSRASAEWPKTSVFASLNDSSRFFEGGSLCFSVTKRPHQYDALRLETAHWEVQPLTVDRVESSFFANREIFPEGAAVFDHALIMRDVAHRWKQQPAVTSTQAARHVG